MSTEDTNLKTKALHEFLRNEKQIKNRHLPKSAFVSDSLFFHKLKSLFSCSYHTLNGGLQRSKELTQNHVWMFFDAAKYEYEDVILI